MLKNYLHICVCCICTAIVSVSTSFSQVTVTAPEVATQEKTTIPDSVTVEVGDHLLIFKQIQSGNFVMGNAANYAATDSARAKYALGNPVNEGPERTTSISSDYYMLETEVTTVLYCIFLNDTDKPNECLSGLAPQLSPNIVNVNTVFQPVPGKEQHAANCISWIGATRFCEWLSDRIHSDIRLPTEAEWEYAARGTQSFTYPWGSQLVDGILYCDNQIDQVVQSPTKSYPENETPSGLFDMYLGVPEWVSDRYIKRYDPMHSKDPSYPALAEDVHILRGRMSLTSRDPIDRQIGHELSSGFRPVLMVGKSFVEKCEE